MIVFSKPNSPDLECRDGPSIEAAEAKGYTRKMDNVAKAATNVALSAEVDTPEDAYERKFGKAPHHRMKLESIIAALED